MRPVKPRPRAKNTSPRNALSRFSKFFFIASRSALPSSSFSFPSTKAPRQSSFSLVVVVKVVLLGVKKKKVQTNLFCRSILSLILFFSHFLCKIKKKTEKDRKREERHHHHHLLPTKLFPNSFRLFFFFVSSFVIRRRRRRFIFHQTRQKKKSEDYSTYVRLYKTTNRHNRARTHQQNVVKKGREEGRSARQRKVRWSLVLRASSFSSSSSFWRRRSRVLQNCHSHRKEN